MKNERLNIGMSILRILVVIFVPLIILTCFAAYGLEIFTGGGYGPNFHFITEPSISGTDGVLFTKYEDLDGKTWWDTTDRTITITISCTVKGFGDISSTLEDIEFAGDEYSISQNESREIGSWGEFVGTLPTSAEAYFATESHYWSKESPEEEGTYTWSANGYTTLVPYKWKWKLSFDEITGEWKPMGAKKESSKKTTGTWTVEHKLICPVCKDVGDTLEEMGDKHDYTTCGRTGCGVKFRKCDKEKAKKHSLQSSCPARDAQGVQCDVSSFWGCEDPTHTHDYGYGSSSGSGDDDDEEESFICQRWKLKRVLVRDRKNGGWMWRNRWRRCGESFTDEDNNFGDCERGKKHIKPLN